MPIRSMLSLGVSLLVACGPGQGGAPTASSEDPGPDLSEALFIPDHLIEVEVEMAPADYEVLRQDGRTAPDVFSGCGEGFEYQSFRATVTVDGETYRDVAIRKKGFLGSLSALRPSLKLNFGTFVEGRTHSGMKRMTLNNNRQDASNTHQCMAYGLFAAAGAIAPRCNFAHVVVNGVDLGIYTHVESVKKPMLRRHFSDDDGNLYEGQGADFGDNGADRMELKTNEEENDRTDLAAVAAALEADDANVIRALEDVIDLDSFLTFWSMEVITSHWDSYTGNSNNYLTYHDPTSDRFHFIPWGADGAFQQIRLFNPGNTDVAVLAEGAIANRLYKTKEGRAMYVDRLRELFFLLWDEDELLAEVDRIGAVTQANPAALDVQRSFIESHGEAMRVALDREASEFPDWLDSPRGSGIAQCREGARTPMKGSFSVFWGGGPSGEQSLELVLNGEPFSPDSLFAQAGLATQGLPGANVVLISPQPGGQLLAVVVQLPEAYVKPGVYEMHGIETSVLVAWINPASPTAPQIVGFAGNGVVTLDAAGMNPGDLIEGSFEAEFVQIGGF